MFCLQTLSASIEFLFDKKNTLNVYIGTAGIDTDYLKQFFVQNEATIFKRCDHYIFIGEKCTISIEVRVLLCILKEVRCGCNLITVTY